MKKICKLSVAFLSFCFLLLLCSCGCSKKTVGEKAKVSYQEKNIVANYKDVLYLPEYFSEKDNYSNVELYNPANEQIALGDGYLYADTMGTYKLMLHESKYLYNIEVADVAGPYVILNGQSNTVYWGDRVVIDPKILDNVDDDLSADDVEYQVTKRGKDVRVTDNMFVAEELGEYILKVDTKDSAGNEAKEISIECKMPKVIVKPVGTKIKITDDIFVGLIDPSKDYTYDLEIKRVTQDDSAVVKGNTITIDKKSVYLVAQTATSGEEVLALNYIYRSDGFMLWDFNDKDISMLASNTQSGLTSSKSIAEVSEGDYAALIKTSGGGGWVTLSISGLEPNTTYDLLSFEVQLLTFPENAGDALRLSFYNRQGESGHTILKKDSKKVTATFSNISTNTLGTANVYAYIHAKGVTEFTIDNLIVQKSTAVEVAKGVYLAFSGGAKNVEKANATTGYTKLRLNVTRGGWNSLKLFATKAAGLKANAEYKFVLNVACDGKFPSFYEEHKGGNDFILSNPGGVITVSVKTDSNGEFEKSWSTIYFNMSNGLSYVEFESVEIREELGTVYGTGITVKPSKKFQSAEFTVVDRYVADGVDAGKRYTCVENITKGGWSLLTVAASEEAGLKANTEYQVTLDVECDGKFPAYFEESKGNAWVLGTPGGKIKFTITTDENGAFTKKWETAYLNTSNALSYVRFIDINIVETAAIPEMETVYGTGITIKPSMKDQSAVFETVYKTVTEGENAGKAYACIENITKGGWSLLTIAANEKAGLKANTDYIVKLTVACDGAFPAYYEESGGKNAFVIGNPGKTIELPFTTDENGTFSKEWSTVYINTSNNISYVHFTDVEIAEVTEEAEIETVYGTGITVKPSMKDQSAVFETVYKTVTDGENAGKAYACIENITKGGWSLLTIAANEKAGLKANTDYIVKLTVACDGSFPAYYEESGGKNAFVIGNPGKTIELSFTTDENGTFSKEWSTVYINTSNNISYVHFTDVEIVEVIEEVEIETVYGTGITVKPSMKDQSAVFETVYKTVTEGENTGKAYASIENITKGGWSLLTITANEKAGLKPNTEYEIVLNVECDGDKPSYFEESNGNDWVLGTPGGTITFTVTTDENGTFAKEWSTVYVNTSNKISYVRFTGLAITEIINSVYGEGITVLPAKRDGEAVFTVSQNIVEEGENAGKTYTAITDITKGGWSMLTIAADSSAGLAANTKYTVTVTAECDGGWPSYYSETAPTFHVRNTAKTITFEVTTDANGAFTQTWNKVYVNLDGAMTYVKFTDIEIVEVVNSVYGAGVTIKPWMRNQQAVFEVTEKTIAEGGDAGKTYTAITNKTKAGWSGLTIKATEEAGLLANTEYTVTVTVACDGSPAYHTDDWSIAITKAPGGTITFKVTTDANGTFTKEWQMVYLNLGTYVDFTNIEIVANN